VAPAERRKSLILAVLVLALIAAAAAAATPVFLRQLAVAGPGLLNAAGTAAGGDFIAFYSAGQQARAGHAAGAYDVAALHVRQTEILGARSAIVPWAYPPPFFFFVTPFATLPYLAALWAWIGFATGALLLAARLLQPGRATVLVVAGFPAVLGSVSLGQNGCLTAALIGGGLGLLARRPAWSGVLFGLVLYKPHLALVLPFCLLAGRHYRALASMAATAAAVVLLSVAFFGPDAWLAFFRHLPTHFAYAIGGAIDAGAMPTTVIAVQQLTGSRELAEAAQFLVTGVAIAGCVLVWSRTSDRGARALALAAGALLATPFALTYDGAILVLPCVIYAARFIGHDRSGWALVLPLLMWLAPLSSPALHAWTGQQIGPAFHLAFLAYAVALCLRTAEGEPRTLTPAPAA
jgi:hypothetical protein